MWGPVAGMTKVVPVYIGSRKISGVVDTAAQVTLVRNDVWSSMQLHTGKPELVQLSNAEKNSDMEGYLYMNVGFVLGGQKYFLAIVVANISDDMILGLDFLKQHKCRIDLEDSLEMQNGDKIYATMKGGDPTKRYNVSRVTLSKKVKIPPHSVQFVSVKIQNPAEVTYAVEPIQKTAIFSPQIVVQGNEELTFCLLNMSPKTVTMRRNEMVARATEIDAMMVRTEEEEEGIHGDLYIHGEEG